MKLSKNKIVNKKFSKKIHLFFLLTFALIAVTSFFSCDMKASPLHGTWANDKYTLTMTKDDSCSFFNRQTGTTESGSFSALLNMITFTLDNTYVFEWDIRNNALYLTYTDNENTQKYGGTFFKIAN